MPKRPSEDYQQSHADPPSSLTPLGIILTEMRRRCTVDDIEGALALARIAAPYLHPRASATAQTTDLAAMLDADLDALTPQP